jgi:hypothetical protein
VGSLPVVVAVAAAWLVWWRRARRSWREAVAVLGALAVSEVVGLILLGLLRHEGVEPSRALAWPFGFAGLAPLRAVAVFGMAAHVISRAFPAWGRWARGLAILLVLGTGFSVVWLHEQKLTEVLLECAAGSLILFLGLWWLEGYGGGLVGPVNGEQGTG